MKYTTYESRSKLGLMVLVVEVVEFAFYTHTHTYSLTRTHIEWGEGGEHDEHKKKPNFTSVITAALYIESTINCERTISAINLPPPPPSPQKRNRFYPGSRRLL